MWKDVFKLIKKLIILVLPFFIILPLYCKFFPYYYMDEEYAMYKQQRDYCLDNDGYNKILILGDSRAKAGIDPAYLSESSYNLSLGGATPIEGYYGIVEYLSTHEKPEQILMAYAPMHYMDVDTLWTRTVYFHNIEDKYMDEILEIANAIDERDNPLSKQKYLPEENNILIENYRMERLMYRFYMPNKYATALKNSGFFFRYDLTKEKYQSVAEDRGHTFYGLADCSDSMNGEVFKTDFVDSPVISYYVERIIQLCKKEGIELIIEQLPMNEMSYNLLQEQFKEHYKEYMNGIKEQYPNVTVKQKPYCYTNDLFGDADHLNKKGSKEFTLYLKEEYEIE